MQLNKNTSLGKMNVVVLVIKLIFVIVVILGLIFFINKIDFPSPKNEIEKIIPNENFKIVK